MIQTSRHGHHHLWANPASIVVIVITLLALAALLLAFDPLYLYNDAFQHVSATRSLVVGDGYATSIIYYDQNYSQQLMPVPQTVWPPGIAILSSLFVVAGVDAIFAVSLVSIIGLALCPILSLMASRRLGLTNGERLSFSLSTIGLGLLVYITWRAGTEGPFLAATLITLVGACNLSFKTESATQALFLIALGTIAAACIRYNGLFLVLSTGCWFLINSVMWRSWQPIIHGVISLSPATAIGLAILYRNLSYTSSLTGGPVSENWASPVDVLRALLEAIVSTIGFNPSSPFQMLMLGLLVLAVVATLIQLVRLCLPMRSSHSGESVGKSGRRTVLLFCLLYVIISMLMMVLVLAPRALDALGYRYLLPLVPYWVLIAALAGHDETNLVRSKSVFYTMVGLLLVGNTFAFVNSRQVMIHDESLWQVTGALSQEINDGETLESWLGARVSKSSPAVSSSAQRLGGLTGWPVLGLTPGMYSLSDWNTGQVHEVVQQYGVCYVLLHAVDTEARIGGGREFFQDLRDGKVPTWLMPVHRSPLLEVFAVRKCGPSLQSKKGTKSS